MHLNSEQNHQGLGPDLPIRRKLAEHKHSVFSSMDVTALLLLLRIPADKKILVRMDYIFQL